MSTQPVLINADEVRDHWWWRPGWHVGQRAYTWHLTFAAEHELRRLARDYQAALAALPQVDPIPPEWLHLTMQGVGFTADVTDEDLAHVVAAVRHRLADVAPAVLTFARPVVLPEAIALPPKPAEPVHTIRGAIRAGIADVWGATKVPEPDDRLPRPRQHRLRQRRRTGRTHRQRIADRRTRTSISHFPGRLPDRAAPRPAHLPVASS